MRRRLSERELKIMVVELEPGGCDKSKVAGSVVHLLQATHVHCVCEYRTMTQYLLRLS